VPSPAANIIAFINCFSLLCCKITTKKPPIYKKCSFLYFLRPKVNILTQEFVPLQRLEKEHNCNINQFKKSKYEKVNRYGHRMRGILRLHSSSPSGSQTGQSSRSDNTSSQEGSQGWQSLHCKVRTEMWQEGCKMLQGRCTLQELQKRRLQESRLQRLQMPGSRSV
jgi:hypothetical protein